LVEGVVIVGSILIAFVLEGWRDDRSMAGEMKQELVNVQRELLRNQDLIVAEVEGLDRIVSASHFLLNDMQTAKDAETIMASDTLAWLVTGWNPTLNVSLGGVSALIASGRLAQVENAELRAGLAGLKDDVDDVVEDEVQARLMNIQQLVPLLAEHLDMEATFGVGVGFLAASNSPGVTTSQGVKRRSIPTRGTVSFPNGAAIRSTLRYRTAWLENARAEMGRLLVHVEGLLELVEQEVS